MELLRGELLRRLMLHGGGKSVVERRHAADTVGTSVRRQSARRSRRQRRRSNHEVARGYEMTGRRPARVRRVTAAGVTAGVRGVAGVTRVAGATRVAAVSGVTAISAAGVDPTAVVGGGSGGVGILATPPGRSVADACGERERGKKRRIRNLDTCSMHSY